MVRALRAGLYALALSLMVPALCWLRWPEALESALGLPSPLSALGGALTVAFVVALRRLPMKIVARQIDVMCGLPDTMQAALDVGLRAEASPFVHALLRRADQEAQKVSTARVVPLNVARPLLSLVPACAVALLPLHWHDANIAIIATRKGEPTSARTERAKDARYEQTHEPSQRLQHIKQELTDGALTRRQAITALLELEQQMTRPERDVLDAKLRDLMSGAGARSLKTVRQRLQRTVTAQERAQLADVIADKRRELEKLRAQQHAQSETHRELAKLDQRFADAQEALREGRDADAREQLQNAEHELRESEQRREQERAVRNEATQQREELQRRDAVESSAGEREKREQAENEGEFERRAKGVIVERTPSAPGGSEPDSREPDLFQRKDKTRVRTEEHIAQSLLGEGESRSEIIITAAERGFASAPYRKVFTDYREHAEALMARDELPPGHAFYVRRYFDLIRPRAAGEPRESAR